MKPKIYKALSGKLYEYDSESYYTVRLIDVDNRSLLIVPKEKFDAEFTRR